jgi:hypothetical protein
MRKRILLLVVVLLGISLGDRAWAIALRIDYAGSVDSILPSEGVDPDTALGGSIQLGTHFSGSFTLQTDASPTGTTADTGYYGFDTPPWTFASEIGSFATEAYLSDQIVLYLGDGSDIHPSHVQIDAGTGIADIGFQPRSVSVFLGGAGQFDPVSSTDLSDVPWDLAAYSGAFVSWEFSDILFNEVFVHA